MCLSPTRYPALGMYFKLTESYNMTTGRWGTWCTTHLRNGPACVISLSYGSIKHLIVKHYSKQNCVTKGKKGEEVQHEWVYVLSPLSPDFLFFVLYSYSWNHNPNTKIDLKEINGVSVLPGTSLLFSMTWMDSYNMMCWFFFFQTIFPIMSNGIFWQVVEVVGA